ncbi:MAG: FAD-dependent oxidoreductase, partial [Planctomycetota bacterium]|nr:FAD-dependent oxidoreductase [Planctomycetota bacterium]
ASALTTSVYSDKPARQASGLSFSYEADQPTVGVHKDTKPPSVLSDGRWSDAVKESVQYDADVTISLDLGKPCPLKAVHAYAFRGSNYDVESMAVSVSADNRQWRQAALVKTEGLSGNPVELTAVADGAARYIKCVFKKKPGAERMLLGEIVVESAAPPEPAAAGAALITTPMQIKRTLDRALADAGVQVLYGCYATDVLRDGQGNPAGVVMADRAGRQAVVAKVVIDATQDATVARLAGAEFRKFGAGTQTVTWVVLAKEAKRPSDRLSVRKLDWPVAGPEQGGPAAKRSVNLSGDSWYEYTLRVDLPNGSWAARANLDQQVLPRSTWMCCVRRACRGCTSWVRAPMCRAIRRRSCCAPPRLWRSATAWAPRRRRKPRGCPSRRA